MTAEPHARPDPTAVADARTRPTRRPATDGDPPPLPTTGTCSSWPTTLPRSRGPPRAPSPTGGLAGLAALEYDDALLGAGNLPDTSSALVDTGEIDALAIDDAVTAALRDAAYAATDTDYPRRRSPSTPPCGPRRSPRRAAPSSPPSTAAGRSARCACPSAQRHRALRRRAARAPVGGAHRAEGLRSARRARRGRRCRAGNRPRRPRGRGARRAGLPRIAEDPAVITEKRRLALLGLSSVGWNTDEPGWSEAMTTELAAAQATLGAVQIVDGSDQLLLPTSPACGCR